MEPCTWPSRNSMPGGRCIFKRERKGDKFDFAYEKGDVSKGAHILRCAACRKDGYNVGLNAYQLKKCFDVGLLRMYRLYCIQNFFFPPTICQGKFEYLSYYEEIYRCMIYKLYINFFTKELRTFGYFAIIILSDLIIEKKEIR